MIESLRNDSFVQVIGESHHGMRLTATCLTISKYCSIVAVKHGLYQRERSLIIDRFLRRINPIDRIIRELSHI